MKSSRYTGGLGLLDARKHAAVVLGPIGTCRFSTRVDYVFIAKGWQCTRCEALEASKLSDHNLVIATLVAPTPQTAYGTHNDRNAPVLVPVKTGLNGT